MIRRLAELPLEIAGLGSSAEALILRHQASNKASSALVHAARWVRRRPATLALWALLVVAAAVHLDRLGHQGMAPWDEVVHAVVALHLRSDPTAPLLYERYALAAPSLGSWDAVQVWLHIPPGGMLAAAASMAAFGANPLAMRLPGVLFILVGMVATYRLGRRLFDHLAGLVGAFFIGFAPLGVAVAHGYVFGDMTDTPLIGLTPVVILAVVKGWQTGQRRWLVLAGIVQWTLYLSKSTLGLVPAGVVAALFLADLVFPGEQRWLRPGGMGLAAFFGTALGLIVPTYLYFRLRFPETMTIESANWTKAFFSNYEGYGAPADFHLTFYLYLVYGGAFALLIIAAVATCVWRGVVQRRRADLVVAAWFASLYLPLTIAVTKAPSMTVAGIGASGLAVGHFVSLTRSARATHHRLIGYGTLGSAAILCIFLAADIQLRQQTLWYELSPTRTSVAGAVFGVTPRGRAMPYLILAVFAAAIVGVGLLALRFRLVERLDRALGPRIPLWTALIAVTVAVPAFYVLNVDQRYVRHAWVDPGPAPAVGTYLQDHVPADATIFVDPAGFHVDQQHVALSIMYWSQRDAYLLTSTEPADVCPLIPEAVKVGSTPVLAATKPYTGPAELVGEVDHWLVYLLVRCG